MITVTVQGTITVDVDGVRSIREFQLEVWADEDGADRNMSMLGENDAGTNTAYAAVEVMADALRVALETDSQRGGVS